jgi:hypothetical protein
MNSRFTRYIAFLHCSSVFVESSPSCYQLSWLVYPLLQMWQRAHDKQYTVLLPMAQIILQHTATSTNSICPCDDDCTLFITSMQCVVVACKKPPGTIWPLIVTRQKWFTLLKWLIQDHQYVVEQLSREGYASLQFWFPAFEIRLQ